MLTRLTGGKVYDPASGVNGQVKNIYIRDGQIIKPPRGRVKIDKEYHLNGKVVMAGAIDMHTHIGGGKVNLARTLMTQEHRSEPHQRNRLTRSGSGTTTPDTLTTGYRYAEMGYTTCFEPAMIASNARQSHMEMADTPILDTGGYVMLGNDDFLLKMLADGTSQATINDYVAWTIVASQCIGLKVVNPGGINAFKFNQRSLDVDETNSYYNVTPREIVRILSRALQELGVPHPLHVHCSNLGRTR